MLPQIVSTLFALFLIAGVPVLSLRSIRLRELRLASRTLIYVSAVFSQWILALICAALLVWSPRDLAVAAFRLCPLASFVRWTLVVTLAGLAGLLLVLLAEQKGWWPKETEITYLLMPETSREKLVALLLVAPTAGLCEEFLYRGFLLSTMYGWCHSLGWAWGLSSVFFAMAHFYQGRLGVLRVAILGALLAWPAVATGSLYPSMAAHFLIDAVAFLWLGPRFLKEDARLVTPVEKLDG